ncbi:DUF58 domain-containing protein [Halosimplex salinum]|uniref:DUF58 domain-containing protein n=1 Tax=Halosimplex salinum TaxID=1710538 RepID=UPI000F48CB73|nr:DUF58 domain-containing protein [Halosimplex salinum]
MSDGRPDGGDQSGSGPSTPATNDGEDPGSVADAAEPGFDRAIGTEALAEETAAGSAEDEDDRTETSTVDEGGGTEPTTVDEAVRTEPTTADETVRTETTTVDEETVTDVDGRWFAGFLLALVAGAAGVFLSNTGVFLAAIVGLVYAGYATLSGAPSAPLVVERTVTPASPNPGDRMTVTVRAENVGSVVLPDVRLADAPPEGLDVIEGDSRGADTVEPGAAVTLRYVLRASRGRHEFGDVVAVARGASGTGVRRTVYDAAESLVCHAPFESIPLAGQTGIGAGRVETDSGGEGVEFYATREYTQGDPASRVDWNRYATTGELTTVTYRESRAATVVFVVDGRFEERRAPGEPSARDLCSYAAVRAADASLDAQNQVGAAVFDVYGSGRFRARRALDPGTGTEQGLRIRTLLRQRLGATIDDLSVSSTRSTGSGNGSAADGPGGGSSKTRSGGSGRTLRLVDWLPGGAQVVFVSPLLDDVAVQAVEQLVARDHATTVLSPDVTGDSTPGGAVERIRREARLRSLVGTERVRAVDWSPSEPLQSAVDRASARWGR